MINVEMFDKGYKMAWESQVSIMLILDKLGKSSKDWAHSEQVEKQAVEADWDIALSDTKKVKCLILIL